MDISSQPHVCSHGRCVFSSHQSLVAQDNAIPLHVPWNLHTGLQGLTNVLMGLHARARPFNEIDCAPQLLRPP